MISSAKKPVKVFAINLLVVAIGVTVGSAIKPQPAQAVGCDFEDCVFTLKCDDSQSLPRDCEDNDLGSCDWETCKGFD